MNVAIVNQTDIIGGAARAAYRLHHALRGYGINSRMFVDRSISGDSTVSKPDGFIHKVEGFVRPQLDRLIVSSLMSTGNRSLHSAAVIPSRWPKKLNTSDIDLVNLHWVAGGMMSLRDIAKIKKPVVWTLHDMWPFCGTEHYGDGDRWVSGYARWNRPNGDSGFDIDRWAWNQKIKLWRNSNFSIVCPSNWMAKNVKQSILFEKNLIKVIPNAIDTSIWRPIDMLTARGILQISCEKKLVLFGAIGAGADHRKGFDLLMKSIEILDSRNLNYELVVFGGLEPERPLPIKCRVHYVGALHDDISLSLLYSAVDVFVIPSRIDNLPNTGIEAQACGTPVVAFDVGGLSDIVQHGVTGYLALENDVVDLAQGIEWVINKSDDKLRTESRVKAVDRWSPRVVAKQYYNLYSEVINA